jgi:hypothetical protein
MSWGGLGGLVFALNAYTLGMLTRLPVFESNLSTRAPFPINFFLKLI